MNDRQEDEERQKPIQNYEAMRTCSHCCACGKVFEADTPIWRKRMNHRLAMFGWTYDTLPCCEACASKSTLAVFEPPAPCGYCGRIVHNELRLIDRKHVFCCDRCREQTQTYIARQKRVEARGVRECLECGVTFRPARMDAKFCGGACKQKSYRKRVTDNKSGSRDAFNSRNAE